MSGRQLSQLQRLPVTTLNSVSDRKAQALGAFGIETVLDLITHYPRRWIDRTHEAVIGDLIEGESARVTATVVRGSSRRLRGGRSMAEIVVQDGTGTLSCTFFNQPWRAKQFDPGDVVTVFGKLRLYRGRRQMANPVLDLVGDETGRIVPVYAQSDKERVKSLELARYIAEALERAKEFSDPLPEELRRRYKLVSRTEAFRSIHRPETFGHKDAARRRLAFDELLRLQLLLVSRRRAAIAASDGIAHEVEGRLLEQYVEGLPFDLTDAQRRAISDIRADLAAAHPMNRLLQGDVGAGKTVVALAALLVGVEGGYQGAFMVPTEVLAEQHHLSACRLLDKITVPDPSRIAGERPLAVELLTNRTTGTDRNRILSELKTKAVDIVIGTHALISEGVEFSRLGIVVVDEQHRFGVEQRAALREKSAKDPDLLVMTATPIPRTAAMTVYGDLDHTILDELPLGRSPVETHWLEGERREKQAWTRVRDEVASGRQAYVVCARVGLGEDATTAGYDEPDTEPTFLDGFEPIEEEVFKRPPRTAVEEQQRLREGPLAGLRVGLLHGQMPARERQPVMEAFRRGEIDVLVATTVIEVGVDVANATVMVICDADRFGIAQLHQLRGRVGRAHLASWCYLLTGEDISELAEGRMEAMVRLHDGFLLAEADLELRGEGTVLGARQKGRSDLKLARLGRDRDLVDDAREVATAIVDVDPTLGGVYQPLKDEVGAMVSEDEQAFLFRS